jgi:signal transduction histidine kinase
MSRLSLRARATMLGTLAFALLLGIAAAALVVTLETRLTAASDDLSRSRVRDLLALAASGDLPRVLRTVDDNGAAQVVGPGGQVLAASPNLEGKPPVAHLAPTRTPQRRTFRAPDDSEIETYRFWFASGPSPDGPVTVYVGDSLESVSEASATLRHVLRAGVPGVLLLLALVFWWLLGRALARLDRIRAEVDRISEENLDARVAEEGRPDEVGRLATTMNALLSRLETSAQRQRDFVADVSHDLQSPLAAQRVALEVALSNKAQIDVSALRHEVLGATTEMEHLVRNLLLIATLDSGPSQVPVLLDLDDLVLEEALRIRGDVRVDTSGVSAAPAYADPSDASRIVRNLLDNAVAHARSRVSLTVEGVDSSAVLVVADDGEGVPPEHRDQIFERFHRAESARTPTTGSGLGLAIARDLAIRNDGTLELLATPGGAHLRLALPAGPTTGIGPDHSRT